jgi:hypothetical protein
MTVSAKRTRFAGRCIAAAVAFAGFVAADGATSARAQSYESYGVFCAGGRIEVDSRSEEQMRSQRGACQLSRFSSRSDAEGFARRNFGGIGSRCSCR